MEYFYFSDFSLGGEQKMSNKITPDIFEFLCSNQYVEESDIIKTSDDFFLVYRSLSSILSKKGILHFFDSHGEKLCCDKFFDDWFLYAVPNETNYTYSLVKFREQEYDAKDGNPADGDTPGVTVSFISFNCNILVDCLFNSVDENIKRLNFEINRVVAYRGQHHSKSLKKYFNNPLSEGSYLIADLYVKHIASYVKNDYLPVPECYKEIVQQSISYKNSVKLARLPLFIKLLNQTAGYVVCDNDKIYIKNSKELSEYEFAAILATHTGNVSRYSFSAEVEYHARFLTPLARVKIPFFGKSIYDSAIRADMTVCDTEFEGPAPFYQLNSKIVRRQYELHNKKVFLKEVDR